VAGELAVAGRPDVFAVPCAEVLRVALVRRVCPDEVDVWRAGELPRARVRTALPWLLAPATAAAPLPPVEAWLLARPYALPRADAVWGVLPPRASVPWVALARRAERLAADVAREPGMASAWRAVAGEMAGPIPRADVADRVVAAEAGDAGPLDVLVAGALCALAGVVPGVARAGADGADGGASMRWTVSVPRATVASTAAPVISALPDSSVPAPESAAPPPSPPAAAPVEAHPPPVRRARSPAAAVAGRTGV
jgi:hypothetical protein